MPAEIPDGAVIIARAILNSSLWTMRVEDRIVALTCIALCNRRRKKWFDGEEDVTIERGQFVRSREKLAEACNLPLQVVRTSLDHLQSTNFLTRRSTRGWTMYTLPKYQHYQDLTKYSDSFVERSNPESNPTLTTNNNNKEETKSKSKTRPEASGGTGFSVVVVVGPDKWADPILGKPSFRLAQSYLEEIKMAKGIAYTYAMSKPIGLVLRVVQQAKLQRSPAGWARNALDNDWSLPEANAADLQWLITRLKDDLARTMAGSGRSGTDVIHEKFPRKAGETEDQWFKRASKELVASKKGGKK